MNISKKIMIIPLLLLALILCCNKYRKEAPKAVDGILDLYGWDLSNDGVISLDGEWHFYWKKNLTDAWNKSNYCKLKVPASWTDYRINGQEIPVEGYATYRLLIRSRFRGQLRLYCDSQFSASSIWINHEFKASIGTVGTSYETERPRVIPTIIDFDTNNNEIEIVIQVSNFRNYNAGITQKIMLGSRASIELLKYQRVAFDLFIFATLFVISLYHFVLYFFRKKEKSLIWFSSLAFLLSIRSLLVNERFLLMMFPDFNWELFAKLDYLTISLVVPLALQFFFYLFPDEMKSIINRIFHLFGIAYTVSIVFFPMRVYTFFLKFYHIVIILLGVYLLVVLILSLVRKRDGARIVFLGFVILFFTGFNDILLANDIIHSIHMGPLGFSLFFLTESLNLSIQLSKAFSKVEKFSETLEYEVQLRTKELQIERNKLKFRNEDIEKDLELARKIQQQLIPSEVPADYIYYLYKPMDRIGGDLFDYQKFRDSNKIGIFISDVSGHGVPAALITTMIKSLLLQAGFRRDNPAELLSYINNALLYHTGGNFITAIYATFEPDRKIMVYANAGHHPPYNISPDGIAEITGKRGLPLAIVSNDNLQKLGKSYENNEVTLQPNSKILFFTDGLIETRNRDNEYFDDRMIFKVFLDAKDLPSKDFVNNLYRKLIDFNGGAVFEDDICIICLDI